MMPVRVPRRCCLAVAALLLATSTGACDDAGPTAPALDSDTDAPLPSAMLFSPSAAAATTGPRDRNVTDDRHRPDSELARFGGFASLIRVTGSAPERVARIEVTRSTRGRLVDLVEGTTTFSHTGDLTRFGEVLEALRSDVRLYIKGEGRLLGPDGAIAALRAHVEIAQHDGGDRVTARGWATLESLTGTPPNQVMGVVLANPRSDVRIPVSVVERSTAFSASGDVQSFGRLLDAFRAGVGVWIIAQGERNDEGVLVASAVLVELRAERDGHDRDRERDGEHQHDRERDRQRHRDGTRDRG